MSEEKYYTPHREEFHIGFEYEILYSDETDWRKQKIEVSINIATAVEYLIPNKLAIIRVKRLDHDDIEAKGWKLDGDFHGFVPNIYFMKSSNPTRTYILEFNPAQCTCKFSERILGMLENSWDEMVIRNAGELAFIMQAIGITK